MRPRLLPSVAIACCAVVGLGACTSQPGTKAVTRDMIESLAGVDDAAKACMLDRLDAYSSDELEAIGEDNIAFTSTDRVALDEATPELQAFVEDLQSCLDGS